MTLLETIQMVPPAHIAVSAGILALASLIYQLFFSPLAHLPGPRITVLTRLWIIYYEFKGNRTVVIDQLHENYGPVVRVAPDEVSFNSAEALRDIYGIRSDVSKSDFYDLFVYYDERNTFTSLDRKDHSQRKRLVADKYAKSYVVQPAVAEEVRKHAGKFVSVVSQNRILDVYEYLHYYAMDVITNHVYGAFGTSTLTDPEHRALVFDLSGQKHRTRLYLLHYLRSLMAFITKVTQMAKQLTSGGGSSDFHVRGDRLNRYGKDSVVGYRETQFGKQKNAVAVCEKLYGDRDMTDAKAAAECMDHMVAGVDTTGDAMCVLMWKLSTPSCLPIQEALFRELKSLEDAFDPVTKTAPIAALDALPYLDAVIREGLRWRAPVPMTLFRVVPKSAGGKKMIAGVVIPAGIVVGCQAYSVHRIASVYDDPDEFRPERWLTDDQDKLSAMKALFWPFSSGARMCLGHNIALAQMKLAFGAVYRHYKTTTMPGCTDDSMAMDDQLTSGVPYGLKCELAFEKREE
ncbi:hypothetical protein SBRCBS47491_001108 [Sporothrix bragantina]|uniref:Cytochrome P450 n=1 Tax=Sporothrix bragantina TaxID=671064 RepID=A0ABP0AVZ3_9PEZI